MRMLAFLRNQGGTRAAVFELDGSWSSALGGAPFHLYYASVHHGAQHHVGEIFLSSQSNSGFRVNPDSVGVFCRSFGEGGRCQLTCPQPHYLTVAFLIFLRSTISMLLGRSFFSNHGMGGRRMLFLPMRGVLRFC